jgi:integrase
MNSGSSGIRTGTVTQTENSSPRRQQGAGAAGGGTVRARRRVGDLRVGRVDRLLPDRQLAARSCQWPRSGAVPSARPADSPEVLLFGTSSGGYLARSNWDQTFRRPAEAIGLPAVRPHELRHTGATLAGATGATPKELMRRLRHSSPPPRSSTSTPQTTATGRSPAPSLSDAPNPGKAEPGGE